MKRLWFLVVVLAMYSQSVMGQCPACAAPNPADYNNDNGFYPPSDTAYVGTAYDQEIKIVFPLDTTVGIITTRFTEFKILSINNVPSGLQITLDRPDSLYTPPNTTTPASGCAHVCGTPTTANNATDSVVVELFVKTDVGVNTNSQAKYHLRVLGNTSKAKAWALGLKYEVYPNPATHYATLHYAIDHTTDVNIEILDLTGKRWNHFHYTAQTPGDYYLPLMEKPLPAGMYLIKIATDKGETTHKWIVNP